MSIEALSYKMQAETTQKLVGKLLGDYDPDDTSIDFKNGTFTAEGFTFTSTRGKLKLMGYCERCQQEVPSIPIHGLEDLNDLKKNFKPEKHICGDI
ncbi:MAG: hypothetical protein KQI81_08695 [Deltaproteobacteria bacterium]|nr:hypothetical protein [Deltaproteobacteria bacterium]